MKTADEIPTGWDALPVILETFVHTIVQAVPYALAVAGLVSGALLIAAARAARR